MDFSVSAYKAGSALCQAFPRRVAENGARAIARTVAAVSPERRQVVERNLQRIYEGRLSPPQLRRATGRVFDSYARYYVDSFRLPSLSVHEVDAGFAYEGYESVERTRSRGLGPILALPHMGGWEWAAFWLTEVQQLGVTAVVEPLEPPELFDWFLEFRESLGMHIVPLGAGAGAEVIKAIKRGDVVCLLSDRDIGGGGVEVEFFGERTRLPGGPATLAIRTGTDILPSAVYFRDDHVHAVVRPPLAVERSGSLRDDVKRITQALAHELEGLIRREPEQWFLMQPNWPSDRRALGLEAPE